MMNWWRNFMNEQKLTLRRWPRRTRSEPTRVARRLCLIKETWFGYTYARIVSPTNARASYSHALMDHSKCFARSMIMPMKLIFQVHMCRGQPWGSPLITGETPLKTCKKDQGQTRLA
jgi:hypothetical protein